MKRVLRGRSQAGKGERQERKAAQTKHRTGEQRRPGAKAATTAAGGLQAGNKGDGGQTASRQRRPNKKRRTAASRGQDSGTPAEKCRNTGHKSRRKNGRPRKNDQPGRRHGTPGAEKPLRTGKIRVRSFACPEGPCEPGPPKNRFAVFGWHGLFLLRNARSAEQKGAPPPFIPRSLLKKAGENFHVGPILAGLAISPQVKYHKRDFFRIGRGNGTWAGMQ